MTDHNEKSKKSLSQDVQPSLHDELLETRQLLHLIMENNPFSIFWKDRDLVYRGCNQRFVQMSGFTSADEVNGKTDFDMPWGVNNEIGAEACRASDARVISSGLEEMHIIEKIQQNDGVEVWTDTSKVPIRNQQGDVTGVLCVLEDITERKRIEQQLENANAELKRLSRIDSLTQLYNRRYFDEQLAQEWKRALRAGTELAIILFDVDHFKQFNDKFGHQAGDACLSLVGKVARQRVKRATDIIARYGGEEFIVLLAGSDREGALALAEDIRTAIEETSIDLADGPSRVTVSLGVASAIPTRQNTTTQLISLADKALYEAKDKGRNRAIATAKTM